MGEDNGIKTDLRFKEGYRRWSCVKLQLVYNSFGHRQQCKWGIQMYIIYFSYIALKPLNSIINIECAYGKNRPMKAILNLISRIRMVFNKQILIIVCFCQAGYKIFIRWSLELILMSKCKSNIDRSFCRKLKQISQKHSSLYSSDE